MGHAEKMKNLNAEIEALEGKRAAEKDETKQAVMQEMIDGKVAEFQQAEKDLAAYKAKQAREKALADAQAEEDKMNEVNSKAGKLTEVNAKSEHNEGNQELEHTKFHLAYMTTPSVQEFCAKTARERGENYLEGFRADRHKEGFTLPRWMREFVMPQPTGEATFEAMHGKRTEQILGKGTNDLLVRDASGTNSGGGSAVPLSFEPTLFRIPQRNAEIVRRTFVKRAVGKTAQFPRLGQGTNRWGVVAQWGNAGAANGEGTALSEDTPVLNQLEISTERLGLFSQTSLKFLRVNDVGFEAELAWMYRGAATEKIDRAILQGVAGVTNAPNGINTNTAITNGVNVVARQVASQVSYTDLNNLQFEAADGVMDQGIYVISAGANGAMKYIAGLDDASGRPVFRPEDTWGPAGPATIAGRPYVSTVNNTTALGGRGDVIWGDFMGYGTVIDTDNMAIERSDHFAFTSGLVTFRMILYVGGKLLGNDMFSVLGDVSTASSSSSSSSS